MVIIFDICTEIFCNKLNLFWTRLLCVYFLWSDLVLPFYNVNLGWLTDEIKRIGFDFYTPAFTTSVVNYQYFWLFVYPSLCLCILLSVCLSFWLFVYPSVCLSVCLLFPFQKNSDIENGWLVDEITLIFWLDFDLIYSWFDNKSYQLSLLLILSVCQSVSVCICLSACLSKD